jgi:hypothetical protein
MDASMDASPHFLGFGYFSGSQIPGCQQAKALPGVVISKSGLKMNWRSVHRV